jgi:dihydrolipoamide dehydrogenase
MKKFDVAIIGAGPGGYVAGIRAGQLGKKTVVIEKDKLGGVCLNYGCIPSKAIIHLAHLYRKIKWLNELGFEVDVKNIDFKKIQEWKRSVISRLIKGINFLFQNYGVEYINGVAKLKDKNTIIVNSSNGEEEIYADNLILAHGSKPAELPNLKFDGIIVIDSTAALELTEIPKDLLVVGGGAIGLELGCVFQNFGSNLYVVEIMDQLLPGFDREISETLRKSIERKGGKIFLNSTVEKIEKNSSKAKVIINKKDAKEEIEVDKILLSVGRVPNDIKDEASKLRILTDKKGFILIDEYQRTNISNIYAIGDITGPPYLAHRASKQGIVAAEVIAGMKSAYDYRAVPSAFFTDPEVISVGLSYDEASKNRNVILGKFPFIALGRALAYGFSEGFVKVVADQESKVILGMQMIGEGVSDLSGEAALAIEMAATLEDLGFVMHPHPTLTEAVMESAENALKKAIHIINK